MTSDDISSNNRNVEATVTASCDDGNDIAISGSCSNDINWGNTPPGQKHKRSVEMTASESVNWGDDAISAGWQCDARATDDGNSNEIWTFSLTSKIICIAVE